LALENGALIPYGLARVSFQMLGYDFLYDTDANKVRVLR